MPVDLDIAVPADDAEMLRFAAIAARSLSVPVERTSHWVQRVGARNVRVVHRGEEVVGGLGLLPMGQWFGGRAVPSVGITVVAVAPEHRSRGIAGEMMRTVLEEARRDGVALSTLYPATFPVYRAAGYETAGNRFVYRIPLTSLGPGAREPEMRAASGPEDAAAMRLLYDGRARTLSGWIDRTPYFWQRVLEPAAEEARAYLVGGRDGPEGYVVVSYRPAGSALAAGDLPVRDVVVRTPAAARRVLRFLGDHRSISGAATLQSGPGDPLLLAAREERLQMSEMQRWMLRVVDVRAALEQRGWPGFVSGEVHLDVRDALVPENARRWVLEVAGGRAQVREGGSGALAIDVRGLAALYSGYLPAEELRAAGLCDGAEEHLARASALFAGPAPWMPEMF